MTVRSNPIFNMNLLRSYQLIDKPGTYMVSAACTIHECDVFIKDEYPRHLIPLKALTLQGLTEIAKILKHSNETTVPFCMVRENFMTGAIFDNELVDASLLPIKGEKVLATFEQKGTEILCTHIELLPREELDYIDPDKFDNFMQLVTSCL